MITSETDQRLRIFREVRDEIFLPRVILRYGNIQDALPSPFREGCCKAPSRRQTSINSALEPSYFARRASRKSERRTSPLVLRYQTFLPVSLDKWHASVARKNVSVVAAYPANKGRRKDRTELSFSRVVNATFATVIEFVSKRVSALNSCNKGVKKIFLSLPS